MEELNAINGKNSIDVEPVVSPDGSYMVFYSAGREDNFSKEILGDIYVSFRLSSGNWSQAVNLGRVVNSEKEENFAAISPDGKYLFFSSSRESKLDFPSLYWISSSIIDEVKK